MFSDVGDSAKNYKTVIFKPKPSKFWTVPRSPTHTGLICGKTLEPNITSLGPFKVSSWLPPHPAQQVQIQKIVWPNRQFYLQQAVTSDWMGCIALWEHIPAFFSRAEKPSENITRHLFLMNMKGLRKYKKFSYLELFWEKKAAEDCCEYVSCGSAVLFHNIVQP
jgi:hypothetical protein